MEQSTPDISHETRDRVEGALLGARIGDALAMPVHWYYDRAALNREYGRVTDFLEPREPHPGSILCRSRWEAPRPELDILGADRRFRGERGVHYHRNLKAGEKTLTLRVAEEAWRSVNACQGHAAADFLRRYMDLLLDPPRHRDTYIEECHRGFFTHLGRGRKPENCAVEEKHVSGLAMMLSSTTAKPGLPSDFAVFHPSPAPAFHTRAREPP